MSADRKSGMDTGPGFEAPWPKWPLMFVVMTGTFMAILDSSIVNVGLPYIMTALGVPLDDAEWILTAFMLAAAVSMPLTGWIGDRVGYGRMYLGCLAVFTVGSAMCSMAWNVDSLILARIIQAAGAGIMQPAGMAMIIKVFGPGERGRAIGIWGIGAMVAPTIGPTLGGYLTEYFGWRSVFTVNIPVGVLLMIFGAGVIGKKEETAQPTPFDWYGFISLSVFLICLLMGLDEAQQNGWDANEVRYYLAGAALAFSGFVSAELTAAHPVVPFQMFRHKDFSVGLLLALVRAVALFGAVFLLPVFLENLQGRTAVQTGIILVPAAVTIAVFMPISGTITDKYGARWPAVFGVVFTCVSLWMYRDLDYDSSSWAIIYPQFFRGAGIALMLTPVATAAMNAVEPRHAGIASGLLNVAQRAGGSLGIALLSTVLTNRQAMHKEIIGAGINLSSLSSITGAGTETGRAAILGIIQRAAAVRAFDDVFVLAAGITILGLLPAFLLSAKPAAKRGENVSDK